MQQNEKTALAESTETVTGGILTINSKQLSYYCGLAVKHLLRSSERLSKYSLCKMGLSEKDSPFSFCGCSNPLLRDEFPMIHGLWLDDFLFLDIKHEIVSHIFFGAVDDT